MTEMDQITPSSTSPCPGCVPDQSGGLRPAGLAPTGFPELTGRPDTKAGGLFLKAGEEITSRSDLPRPARPARPCQPAEPGPRTDNLSAQTHICLLMQ